MPEQQRASNNANTWTLGRETRGVENPGGWHLCHTHTFRTATTDKTGKFPPLCCYMFFSSDSSKPSPSQLESRINDDDNSEIFPAPKRNKKTDELKKRVGTRNENLHTKTQKSRGSCTRISHGRTWTPGAWQRQTAVLAKKLI